MLLKTCRVAGALVCALFASTAQSQSPPDVQQGVAWLQSIVQVDGSIAEAASRLADTAQTRAETASSLAELSTAPTALLDAIANEALPMAEPIARRALALYRGGRDPALANLQLGLLRNPDTGFAPAQGFASSTLDTALALQALATRADANAASAAQSLAWLRAARLPDGGWGINDASSVYVTSQVVLAAQAWSSRFAVADITTPARTWLLARRNGQGVYADLHDNAMATLALLSLTAQADVLQPLSDALVAAQSANGSWGDDGYLTALALRARWRLTHVPDPPTTGDIQGKTIDQTSGAPLADVTVTVVGDGTRATSSGSDGSFRLDAIEPGTVALRFARIGYATRLLDVPVSAAQTANLGSVALSPAPLSANVFGTVRSNTGAVLRDVVISVGTATTLTDVAGNYSLSGLSPGTVTLSAAKAGYHTATASSALQAGFSYNFSPALYPTSTTPPTTATLRGVIYDKASNQSIAGATVSAGATQVVTLADGKFEFSGLTPGAFSLTVHANGHLDIGVSGSTVPGINDVGRIGLDAIPPTNTLSGTVSDALTNAPIAGAVVAVLGQSANGASGPDGRYSVAGIVGQNFVLQTTAAGYLSSQLQVSLPQAGTASLDIPLTSVGSTGLSFEEVQTNQPVYGPSDDIELEIEVRNAGTATAQMVIDADVTNSAGELVYVYKANVQGLGQFPPNLPLSFAPGSTTEIETDWVPLRLPAGVYNVFARGKDLQDRVLAEGATVFSVRAEAVIRGAVTPNPPLAQAGTGQTVHLESSLLNVGNASLGAGQLDLSIVLENPDNLIDTQPRATLEPVFSGTPMTSPRRLLRDADGNFYTYNNSDRKILKISAQGDVSVHATLPAAANDLAIDPTGTLWASGTGNRLYSITAQGVVDFSTVANITTLAALALDGAGNVMLAGRYNGQENGVTVDQQRLVTRTPQGIESVLLRNGFSQPYGVARGDAGELVVTNYGDHSLVRVAANGALSAMASGLNRPKGVTRAANGDYYVANSGDGRILRVDANGQLSTFASGIADPADLRFAANGDLYVSSQTDDRVVRVDSSGTVHPFAQGVANQPEGMKYAADGNLYLANGDGSVRRMAPDGTPTTLATGLSAPRGLALADDGAVLVANYSNGTVTRIAGASQQTLISGLANPYGVALDPQQRIYVTERGANRIREFAPDGSPVRDVESFLDSPSQVAIDAVGRVFVRNTNLISVIENGTPRVLARGFNSQGMTPDGNGGVLALKGYDVYRIAADGTQTRLKTLTFYPYDVAQNSAGLIVLRDYSGKRLQTLDAGGNIAILVDLPDYPAQLLADNDGQCYVRLNNRKVLRIETDASLSEVVPSESLTINGLGVAQNGLLLAWTSNSRVYSLNGSSGVATLLKSGVAPSGASLDAAGRLQLIFSSEQYLATYDASGQQIDRLDGFSTPTDILWTGSELRFVDGGNRLYSLAPGGYPQRLGNFGVQYLGQRGGDLVGTASGRVYAWSPTSNAIQITVAGSPDLRGLAVRSDGAVAVADTRHSRIVVYTAGNTVESDHAGLVRPQGLAFDSQGNLYVANNVSGTIARFDSAATGGAPSTYANVSAPKFIDFDPDGTLWASRSGGMDKIAANGIVTAVTASGSLQGVLASGSATIGADTSTAQLLRLDGNGWDVIASGISQISSLVANPDGSTFIANRGNATVVRYLNGALTTVASGVTTINAMSRLASGELFLARDGGLLTQINPDGSVNDLRISTLLGRLPLYGVFAESLNRLFVVGDGYDYGVSAYRQILYRVVVTQPQLPPPAGTVVHQVSRAMPELPPSGDYLATDFGDWTPPYGGDFKVVVERSGVAEGATNFIHVGPHATSELTASSTSLPPGDQTLQMCLNLSGADFTSISRVEMSRVSRLAPIAAPNGMAADREGNIYFTDAAKLYKKSLQGVTSTLLDGLTTAFGLAADSQQNLYLAAKNAASGRYELLKIDLSGQSSVLADLGVTRANGVAVDSRDEILVGSPGKLLRVSQSGVVSTVATTGLPNPRGLTIDGHDNVYVQNESNFVSMIRADGHVFDVYSRGDGVDEPVFEGDGYPNIAADCAENLYIATSQWARINQTGEEHTLAQIVPRTGQVALLFDATRIDPGLNDIDYLAFDRFGNRLLMWNHYEGMIWQVPVTCGAIGVNAHLTTAPGQSLSGMSKPASAAIAQADGRTEYVWSLRDVTAQGDSICFDTNLDGLQLGEQRKSLDSGFVSFQNSFASQDVHVPLEIPLVTVGNRVTLTASTDLPEYRADDTAQVSVLLDNADPADVSGQLRVTVVDGLDAQVGSVLIQDVTVPAGGSLPVSGPFAIGRILPAGYRVKAELAASAGPLARGQSDFAVLPDNANGLANASLATDRLVYQASDRVLISSRAANLSTNVLLENLTVMVQVFDASDAQLYSHGHPVAQLLSSSSVELSAVQTLTNAASGRYRVHQELLDSAGHMLDMREVFYEVSSGSDSGFGLRGTIQASPAVVRPGELLDLSATASNEGNADLIDLPLTIHLVDPELGVQVDQFDQTSTVLRNQSVPFTTRWTAAGRVGATYLAVLTATVGSGPDAHGVTLATDQFRLEAQIAAGILATGGTPQQVTITRDYPVLLEATVRDTVNQPLAGVSVDFVAPGSGASVTFPLGSVAVTDAQGHASVGVVANDQAGSFEVVASAPGVANTAVFTLDNLAPIAATILATGGTPQSVRVGATYPATLQATVRDNLDQPMAGIVVNFVGPSSGAGAVFPAGAVAVTDASGNASVPVQANSVAGPFQIVATAAGVSGTASFELNNNAAVATSIQATGGTPQSALRASPYATPLQATVRDDIGAPMAGISVDFVAPAQGASVNFPAGSSAVTDADGHASVAVIANDEAGEFNVVASATGVSGTANFALSNRAAVATSITATGGTPQSAALQAVYAQTLQATVRDDLGAPMADVTVTFAAPEQGASVSFPDGATAITDAAGRASVAVRANTQSGAFAVDATASGVAGTATFNLTNLAPVASSITATGGTPQSAALQSMYAQPLEATVLDDQGNTMAGVSVDFAAPPGSASVTFPDGSNVLTDVDGRARVRVQANGESGTFAVLASAAGVNGNASFALTNTAAACGSPDPVTFGAVENAAANTRYISNTVVVSGLGSGCGATASVEHGQYRIRRDGVVQGAGDGYTDQPGSVRDGDLIDLSATSGEAGSETVVHFVLDAAAANWAIRVAAGAGVATAIPATGLWSLLALLLALVGATGYAARRRIV